MKSQQAILKSAKKLFWKYGIQKVTVEEICKEAGISKMTFYRRYVNKDHAAAEILEEIMQDGVRKYKAIMSQQKSFPEKVNEVLEMEYDEATNLSPEFIKDIYQKDDSELSDIIQKYTEISQKLLIKDFENAKKEGWVRAEVKPDFIIYMLNLLQEKLQDKEFLALFNSVQEAIAEIGDFFFYGIFIKKRN